MRAIRGVSDRRVGNELGKPTRSVDAVRTLLLRTVSDGSFQPDDRRLLLLLAGLSDCVVDAGEITTNPSAWGPQRSMIDIPVTVIHMEDLPTVGCESALYVLSKRDGGVSVDGNV